MKSIICLLVSVGFALTGFAQDKKTSTNVSDDGSMETKKLPEMVIKRAGSDFSVYLPEYENEDVKIKSLQEAFIAYDLGKDYEGHENYLVTMKVKDGSLAATYDENGKLTSVVEKYNNVKLPSVVIYNVYKNYPGWTIVNDKYLYSQEDGDIKQKQYNLKLAKGDETKKIVVNSKGEILKG
ncbi:secreted protein [Flavobacterium limnosediminis JC2902]|uniref:Secreted protein n=1 Tax=Flavobacterium limnosediminis JC2902 TaxID=1341181 RepID=V6SPY3_9FLAO|nr:hypothetical protein [Flavobacterium limnosediminis]ESU26490.1 secreted protein [Flavobacterium limnosediminis JC2902]